jgi:MMP 1-O-methyltransferase
VAAIRRAHHVYRAHHVHQCSWWQRSRPAANYRGFNRCRCVNRSPGGVNSLVSTDTVHQSNNDHAQATTHYNPQASHHPRNRVQNRGRPAVLRAKVVGAETRPSKAQSRTAHNEEKNKEVTLSAVDRSSLAVADAAKGFMPADEAAGLRTAAVQAPHGVLLEVGSYCGKSAVHLGVVARSRGLLLFSVDHHRGSEENQSGWEWHDTDVVDPRINKMDTLPFFRATIHDAGLESTVVAVVGDSAKIGASWQTPLAFCFIDGGHGRAVAHGDFDAWVRHVQPGGLLAIHDVFPDPADGGRPPYELYLRALGAGFEPLAQLTFGSLRVLRRRV